ncbi:MAG TPA: transglutaminaseTgpA domain-containing protein [Phycisphaerae bacterium]|nr:transglutaminaseTgpA domain-containing protein [Phycisphaerae bacterium]HOJ74698.1 transglutaminaseTgpA domain-containing protein [Phycisphaerae bacterium]HOM52067.1 transglutaminaseTgpA domain-containing protein [Phycisphaerae bacterium]HOQ85861.1 transglutaminaseTgpA domain-containing protein [Phycisphaerae bacterium]HPP28750.1 transglutaminaseTgpA domain-containing protein [Phycisphaerae bacterium]
MIAPSPWSNALLLISVVAPIAAAEGNLLYLIVAVCAGLLGPFTSARLRPTPLLERLSQLIVVLAFGFLLHEYLQQDVILIMALSHFLITVCVVRLLLPRSLREETHVIVLSLVLLVVGAIVSGNVLFAVALVVSLVLGLGRLIRLHVAAEVSRTGTVAIGPAVVSSGPGSVSPGSASPASESRDDALFLPSRPFRSTVAAIFMVATVIGAVVFLVCPRVESTLFRQMQAAAAGPVLTGFGGSEDLRGGHDISPSEQAVMRVKVTGPVPFSAEEHETQHYFRGEVRTRYGRRAGGLASSWGWHRPYRSSDDFVTVEFEPGQHQVTLSPAADSPDTMQYQFWLEPRRYGNLFSPEPILAVASHDFSEVRFHPEHQILHVPRPGRLVRYTVTTIAPYALPLLRAQQAQELEQDPPLIVPVVPLPRTEEILQLIDNEIPSASMLDRPDGRETFVRDLEQFLSSSRFAYTLSPPRLGPGREPVGEFLLDTRQGHCEFFATAMAVVCQLKGIPARMVTGYRGGEYNPVGGFLIVREKHAHAWVEVFLRGKGWLTFDPTPGASVVASPTASWYEPLRKVADFMQFQWASLVLAYDAASQRELLERFQAWVTRPAQDETTLVGGIVAFARELFGWRMELSARDRVLYWVFTLLVIALAVLLGRGVVAAGRWLVARIGWSAQRLRRRAGGGRAEVEFYTRFCRRLESLGLHRRPDQTPAEFADELATRHPALQDAPELIRLYYGQAFGNRPVPPDRRFWIEQFLRQLKQIDPASLQPTSA